MSILKSLILTAAPNLMARDPKVIRRQKLVERLGDQLRLAKDPTYAPIVRRWKRTDNGSRVPIDGPRQVRPWWRADPSGNLVLVLRSGLKTLELEKGKPAVLVGDPKHLPTVLETLIAAAKAGELDAALEATLDGAARGVPKRKAA